MKTRTPYTLIVTVAEETIVEDAFIPSVFIETEGYSREIPKKFSIIGTIPIQVLQGRSFENNGIGTLVQMIRMFPPEPPGILMPEAILTQIVRTREINRHCEETAALIYRDIKVSATMLPFEDLFRFFFMEIGYKMYRSMFEIDQGLASILGNIERTLKKYREERGFSVA